MLGYRQHKCVSQIEIHLSGRCRAFPAISWLKRQLNPLCWRLRGLAVIIPGDIAMDAQRPSMTATGAGAGTIVVICPGCGRQTARHPRPWAAASSRGPHLAAGSRARLNGRPRSRHLPGRSPVGRRPPRSPRRPVATPVLPAPRETPPPRALGAPVSQSLSAPVSANGWPYTVGGARDPAPASSSQAGRSPGRRQGRRRGPGRTAQRGAAARTAGRDSSAKTTTPR